MQNDVFNLFIDDLTILDCAIWHPQRGPIGMSWNIGIQFFGTLDHEGVIFDFSAAKKAAKKIIDNWADHKFICPTKYYKETEGVGTFEVSSPYPVKYVAPSQAFCPLDRPTVSGIQSFLEQKIAEEIGRDNVERIELFFTEENDSDTSYYHYTHGLKNTTGPCQRLVHGHRSPIKVFLNEKRNSELEKLVASRFADKHLVWHENVDYDNDDYSNVHIKYTGTQGEFLMTIQRENVIIYPYETTVENISKEVTEFLCKTGIVNSRDVLVVKAYEGIRKGSSYTKTPSMNSYKNDYVLKG